MPLCLVCGSKDDEVQKMHWFPRNLERCKVWQEQLGMKYLGESLNNHRLCNNHFTADSYRDLVTYRLKRDAIPKRWLPQETDVMPNVGSKHPDTNTQDTENSKVVAEETSRIVAQETPSTSGIVAEETPSTSGIVAEETPSTSGMSRKMSSKFFRNIENLTAAHCTPRKKKLIAIVRKREDQLRKLKRLCRHRSSDLKALHNLTDSNVIRTLFKDMSSVTADFLVSQLKNFKVKGTKGRRWSLNDKILALCIFKRSPRCYNLLRKFVALPNKTTVLSLLKKVPFSVGINNHIFAHINDILSDGMDRCCALLFDEIDIQENLHYDVGEDKILGFEDFGSQIRYSGEMKSANKALVFMLVGLSKNWKQPVAFYFTNNGCKDNLQKCIIEVLHAAKYKANLDVVTTICDMGTNNVKSLKALGATEGNPFFLYEGKRVYTMFDPPHLLKCTYSLFRKHDILIPLDIGEDIASMEASFADIRKAYEIDKKNPLLFRTLHRIKDDHLNPIMQYSMKVSIAAQVLSHTVAAYLYSLISSGKLESKAIATAMFVKEVDTLFDSFNGRTLEAPEGKELRCCIKSDSPHVKYWQKIIGKVKKWTFRRLKKNGKWKSSKPPSQIGWLITLKAIIGVWRYMLNKGCKCLAPRFLNQDPLENLFGGIRYCCGCNDNPTVEQFIGSLKTQILNGLANQAFVPKNCENDDYTLLTNLHKFLQIDEVCMQSDGHSQTENVPEDMFTPQHDSVLETLSSDIARDVSSGNSNVFSVAYVAGFILKGLHRHIICELCDSQLCSLSLESHNIFIAYKEWSDSSNRLTYPSENFTAIVGLGVTALELYLNEFASQSNVLKNAQMYLLSKLKFEELSCSYHSREVAEITVKAICKIGIPWWCKRKNQEIKAHRKEKRATKRKLKILKHQ